MNVIQESATKNATKNRLGRRQSKLQPIIFVQRRMQQGNS